MTKTSNRRQFSRIKFQSDAHLMVAGETCRVEVVDLSLKGALVRLYEPTFILVGSPCVLEIALDNEGDNICMEATVIHHQGELYGLYTREMDIDSVTHLRRLVELNVGDVSLLERELGLLTNH